METTEVQVACEFPKENEAVISLRGRDKKGRPVGWKVIVINEGLMSEEEFKFCVSMVTRAVVASIHATVLQMLMEESDEGDDRARP